VAVLTVDRLAVRYGSAEAVRDVSLAVEEGEVVGVLGPNGAGKSTTMNAIAGLVRPASGRIALEGRPVDGWPVERRVRAGIALVAEGRRVLAPLTVAENLRLGAYAVTDRKAVAERLDEAFAMFGVLAERRDQLAGTLSGGEAAMLVVARALMSRPRLLLLDEPTLGLAPLASARLFERLAELKAAGMTMLIVEQKASGLLDVVDRAAVLTQGRVVAERRAASVETGELQSLYLGTATPAGAPAGGSQ
jgi:branched-chain amino acid transport system ATP-binding protein